MTWRCPCCAPAPVDDMPVTKYKFNEGVPSADPGLYITCLKSERDNTLRWWDGKLWWDISSTRGQKDLYFFWPKGKQARGFVRGKGCEDLYLRKITNQSLVRWGESYKVYSENEILKYLVTKGILPSDWKIKYQEEMRLTKAKTQHTQVCLK